MNAERTPVVIQMVVHNAASWLPDVLVSVREQSYPDIRLLVLDNASTDDTVAVINRLMPSARIIRGDSNIGYWAGTEELLSHDDAPYVLALTDVVLDRHFIERGVAFFREHPDTGAVQSVMLQATWTSSGLRKETRVDSLGFAISRSRRIVNEGHGDESYSVSEPKDIFAVEGAAPFFRRTAIEDCRVNGAWVDPDFRIGPLGYGDDLDVAWRMHLLGHRQVLVPSMISWHDRSTTKGTASGVRDAVSRRHLRGRIPLLKRQLDWANVRLTMVKNDQVANVVRDLPYILAREILVFGYTVLFEPRVFGILPRFVRLLPSMIRKRRVVMARAVTSAAATRRFIT